MTTMLEFLVRAVLTAALGAILGCSVARSAFADGTPSERLTTVATILLAYGLLGAALGVRASGWHGLGLALPGLAALVVPALRGADRAARLRCRPCQRGEVARRHATRAAKRLAGRRPPGTRRRRPVEGGRPWIARSGL